MILVQSLHYIGFVVSINVSFFKSVAINLAAFLELRSKLTKIRRCVAMIGATTFIERLINRPYSCLFRKHFSKKKINWLYITSLSFQSKNWNPELCSSKHPVAFDLEWWIKCESILASRMIWSWGADARRGSQVGYDTEVGGRIVVFPGKCINYTLHQKVESIYDIHTQSSGVRVLLQSDFVRRELKWIRKRRFLTLTSDSFNNLSFSPTTKSTVNYFI